MAPVQQSAQVYMTNATDGNATISVWHKRTRPTECKPIPGMQLLASEWAR